MASGALDGFVGDDLATGKSTVWKSIKNGVPAMFKQGPSRRFFNGKENERIEGVLHTLQEWKTDEEKLEFLRKFVKPHHFRHGNREENSEDTSALDQNSRDFLENAIIAGERLKPLITRRFLEKAFEDGQIRQTGTDIDKIMPPISRFGSCGNNRAAKKQTVIEKLKVFFEKYFGIGTKFRAVKEEPYQLLFDDLPKVAEKTEI